MTRNSGRASSMPSKPSTPTCGSTSNTKTWNSDPWRASKSPPKHSKPPTQPASASRKVTTNMNAPSTRAKTATRIAAIAASALLALTACSATGGKPRTTGGGMNAGQADTPRFTIAMVTHGPPGDTFWDLIRKGAETAAQKDNIDLKYSAELAAPDQANLVQNAIDSKVAGIAVTMAKPEAMAPAIQSAVSANIPVVAFNAGIDAWRAAGAKAYFGQDEQISGEAAGKRLASEGARKVVCVIQDQGNVALESSCAGVKSGSGVPVE